MAMTYTDLKTNVQDITEMTFTDAQLSMFTKQAEQKIYGFIKNLPILKKTLDADSFNPVDGYVLPDDFLYLHSVVQKSGSTSDLVSRKALIPKDYDFLLEAYPYTTQGSSGGNQEMKYYALDSDATTNQEASRMRIVFAPKWNTTVSVAIEYQYQPRSIVDTDEDEEQPWLGTNYDSALLNGTLVEAARFMKAEPDIIQLYDQQFLMSMQQLADTVNVKLPTDSFRPKAGTPQPITVPTPPQPQPQQGG